MGQPDLEPVRLCEEIWSLKVKDFKVLGDER